MDDEQRQQRETEIDALFEQARSAKLALEKDLADTETDKLNTLLAKIGDLSAGWVPATTGDPVALALEQTEAVIRDQIEIVKDRVVSAERKYGPRK